MSSTSVLCRLDLSLTPDQARDLRAHAWHFVFDCYEAKKTPGVTSTGDESKRPPVRDRGEVAM